MKKFLGLLAMILFLAPLYVKAAPPQLESLPGVSDKLIVNKGIMNELKLFKVGDKFYFFNLGSQSGLYVDIYDSSMKLLKNVKIGEFTNREVKISYNKEKKYFGVLWQYSNKNVDGGRDGIFYRFIDLNGNFLSNSVQLGKDPKIGDSLVDLVKSLDWVIDKDGNHLVIWAGYKVINKSMSNDCIFFQRISKDFKLNGEPFSLQDCNDKRHTFRSKVVSSQNKHVIYLSFLEEAASGKDVTKTQKLYYKIIGEEATASEIIASPLKPMPDVIGQEYSVGDILADSSGVYILLSGLTQSSSQSLSYNSSRSSSYKLMKFDPASENFSDIYNIGSTSHFNKDAVLNNNKLYLTAYWVNLYDKKPNEPNRHKAFSVIFDLKTNKASWKELINQPSLNGYRISLGDVVDNKLYFYRSYRESDYSEPVYGYITSFDENILSNNKTPLLGFKWIESDVATAAKVAVAKKSLLPCAQFNLDVESMEKCQLEVLKKVKTLTVSSCQQIDSAKKSSSYNKCVAYFDSINKKASLISERDALVLDNVKNLQKQLGVYFNLLKKYPREVGYDVGNFVFTVGSDPTRYHLDAKNRITPIEGVCVGSEKSGYSYSANTNKDSYTIKFCLGKGSAGLSAGNHTATPTGIK